MGGGQDTWDIVGGGMTLTLDDMPEVLLTYLDQDETVEVLREINDRPAEEGDDQ